MFKQQLKLLATATPDKTHHDKPLVQQQITELRDSFLG